MTIKSPDNNYVNVIVFIVTLITFVYVVLKIWKSNLRESSSSKSFHRHFTGPKPLPIIGNAFDLGSTKDLLNVFEKFANENNGIAKLQIGPFRKFLLVTDYKFIEFLLSSTKILNKSREYKYLAPWLGTGLLTSGGQKWKKHRKIITPAFHFQILEKFVDVFESNGNILIDKLKNKLDKDTIDIYPYITLCALDIICESAMGTSVNAQQEACESDYVKSVKEMCRIVVERGSSPFKMYDTLFKFSRDYWKQKKALGILHKYSNDVISKKMVELKNRKTDGADDSGIKKRVAFLDLLLQSTVDERPLTREEIREEVDTFMFEGHDTTASALSFTIYCLANNPDVQAKAFNEQQEIFGDNRPTTISYGNLQNMKYLEFVIKEALRMYPAVPYYARETDETIEYNGAEIPEATSIAILAYAIHRNPMYFPEPDKFDPNRFENVDGKLPYAYIPFSAGPRNCIGQKYAMLEMKSIISKILRNYELIQSTRPEHDIVLVAESILKSKNGIRIGLKKRTIQK